MFAENYFGGGFFGQTVVFVASTLDFDFHRPLIADVLMDSTLVETTQLKTCVNVVTRSNSITIQQTLVKIEIDA